MIAVEKATTPTLNLERACELLGVARSGLYAWRHHRRRPPTVRELRRARID